MMTYTGDIRLDYMTRNDIPAVHELEVACFPSPWDIDAYYREIANPSSFYLVARKGEEIVGFGGMWTVGDEAHVVTLAVDDDYRRHGIGRLLMHGLLREARRRHAERVSLEVRVGNHPAQGLYSSLGFRTIAFRRGYYPDNGEDAAVMVLEL